MYTLVAQLVEQAAHNRPVVGSSPTGSTLRKGENYAKSLSGPFQ